MEPLSKDDVVIHITVGDVEEAERNPRCHADVKRGIEAFEKYVSDRGFEDFHTTLTKNPRMTERGILHAEGTFAGPSPNGGEQRDVEDFDEYRFIVVEDKEHEDLFLIEAYYHTAKLASFEIATSGLKLLSGEIEFI
jgi:hypothetical protein